MDRPFKLGKKAARHDRRNILFRDILTQQAVPDTYSVDPTVPPVMGGNDRVGDCVMVCLYNILRQITWKNQAKLLQLTDDQIVQEYLDRTNGHDVGMNINDALNWLTNVGWIFPDGTTYTIAGYAQVDFTNPDELKLAASGHLGLVTGVELPDNWSAAFANNTRVPWTDTSQPPDNHEGHCMYLEGYDPTYITFDTWGGYEPATWAWGKLYMDECFYVLPPVGSYQDPFVSLDALHAAQEAIP